MKNPSIVDDNIGYGKTYATVKGGCSCLVTTDRNPAWLRRGGAGSVEPRARSWWRGEAKSRHLWRNLERLVPQKTRRALKALSDKAISSTFPGGDRVFQMLWRWSRMRKENCSWCQCLAKALLVYKVALVMSVFQTWLGESWEVQVCNLCMFWASY